MTDCHLTFQNIHCSSGLLDIPGIQVFCVSVCLCDMAAMVATIVVIMLAVVYLWAPPCGLTHHPPSTSLMPRALPMQPLVAGTPVA